jgi:hypothetical protein
MKWVLVIVLGTHMGAKTESWSGVVSSERICHGVAEQVRNVLFRSGVDYGVSYVMHFCVPEPRKRRWEVISDPDKVQALRHAGNAAGHGVR